MVPSIRPVKVHVAGFGEAVLGERRDAAATLEPADPAPLLHVWSKRPVIQGRHGRMFWKVQYASTHDVLHTQTRRRVSATSMWARWKNFSEGSGRVQARSKGKLSHSHPSLHL